MIKIFLLLFSFVFCIVAFGQQKVSVFLFPEFENGEVVFKNGGVTKAMLNYNLLTEEMMFIQDSDTLVLVGNENIDRISIGEHSMVQGPSTYYFERIDGESSSLYVRKSATILSKGKMSAYGGNSQVSSISSISRITDPITGSVSTLKVKEDQKVKISNAYYCLVNKVYYRLDSKRAFLKAFPKKKAFVKAFFEENNISFNKQDNLLDLLDRIHEGK